MVEPGGTVRRVVEEHVPRHSRVCVALSGGLDSVVLLHVMAELAPLRQLQLSALHVNHGLSARTDEWAAFCKHLCAELSVALRTERVRVDTSAGMGVEAAARSQRYAVFAGVAADYVLLAHHMDDQAETLLLQLLRGAGVDGLSAMPVVRDMDGKRPYLLRPLLDLKRAQLLEFARSRGMTWIEDDSNADAAFDRNFLRNRVLPVLEQRFPGYRATLSRASRNLADAAQLLDLLGRNDLSEAGKDGGLKLSVLECWPKARALNALRCLFRHAGYPVPHRAKLEEGLRQSLHARRDAQVRVDCGAHSLRPYRGVLYLVSNVAMPEHWQVEWRGEDSLALPRGLGTLRFHREQGTGISAIALTRHPVTIRLRSGGERMSLGPKRPHRDLRRLYQDAGVPPWLRERMPLLFCGSRLAYVPLLGVAAEFQAAGDEATWRIDWVTDQTSAGAGDEGT